VFDQAPIGRHAPIRLRRRRDREGPDCAYRRCRGEQLVFAHDGYLGHRSPLSIGSLLNTNRARVYRLFSASRLARRGYCLGLRASAGDVRPLPMIFRGVTPLGSGSPSDARDNKWPGSNLWIFCKMAVKQSELPQQQAGVLTPCCVKNTHVEQCHPHL